MEIWVAKDGDGRVLMYDYSPEWIAEDNEFSGCGGDYTGFPLAEKIGGVLGAGQKAKVISYDFRTGKSEIEIYRDPIEALVESVDGFLSGKVTKAALTRSLKAVKSQAK